ncbi:MAG TPA: alpha/beta fold hydrolase [Azospirillaceae bacterium]|nr:alpha/beta fold hydrolase [Azospirillaceae bacterium]
MDRLLEAVHVKSTAEYAAQDFLTPDRVVPPPMLPEPAGGSVPLAVPGWPTHVNARSWGRPGAPSVILMHGWSGQLGDLYGFVEPLVELGFRVVAFDAPAHGRSAGETSSAPEFAQVLRAVADAAGPVHAVVAHSMGVLATMIALKAGLKAARVALIGAPADPVRYVMAVARQHRLDADETADLLSILDARFDPPVSGLNLPGVAAQLSVPALLLHSVDDKVTPVSATLQIAAAWRGARTHLVEGLGHRRILADAGVIGEVTSFVAGSPAMTAQGVDRLARVG